MPYIDPEFERARATDQKSGEGTDVDKNVLDALPTGTRVIWAATHGASAWRTKIDTELPDGSQKSYFMKVYITPSGQAQALGEFESHLAMNSVIPENVPEPIAVGALSSDPQKHFLLLEFRDLADELPSVPDFAAAIAKLHRNSASPAGKFGFHVPTSQPMLRDNAWCDTWEELFTHTFRKTVEREREIQGQNEELEELENQMLEKVIPRLLRPMETGGRKLKPALLHGALWHGNLGVDMMTDQPALFDCNSFYGHHEYDLGMWRASRYRMNKTHVRAYHKLIEMSAPAQDHDDRNALYALRFDLEVSCACPANKKMRLLAMDEMKRLVDKYPSGFVGFEDAPA